MIVLWGLITILAGLVGVVLTIFTLSGVWLSLAVAIVLQLTVTVPGASTGAERGELFSWWTLGVATALALLGEVFELGASALGTKMTGGGRSASIGSVVGGLGGAIVGSIFIPIPIAGTIIGAVGGAGIGALAGERGIAKRSWGQSTKVAGGAATGRAAALIVKIALAVVVCVILAVASFMP
jgi:uncharacterized protein